MTPHALSFSQRLDAIRADILLRRGYLGAFNDFFGEYRFNTDAYAAFGVTGVPGVAHHFVEDFQMPSLADNAFCPVCGGDLAVKDVSESTAYSHGEDRAVVIGTVVCPGNDEHTAKIDARFRTVTAEVGEFDPAAIDAAAERLGF